MYRTSGHHVEYEEIQGPKRGVGVVEVRVEGGGGLYVSVTENRGGVTQYLGGISRDCVFMCVQGTRTCTMLGRGNRSYGYYFCPSTVCPRPR